MRQPELLRREPLPIRPKGSGREPRLWIRNLTIWRKHGEPIREITFRAGLNIIWSPDASAGSGAIGHGGGKTMLCRMIRYCLGENGFAPDGQRSRVWEALPEGFLSAEVRVDGEDWLIVRSLGQPRRDFALKGGNVDDAFVAGARPTGLQPFTDLISKAFIGQAAELMPAKVGAASAWGAALAWLTRDQECRFDRLLHWRDPGSDSRTPVAGTAESERLEIIRALTGSLTTAELATRRRQESQERALAGKRTELSHREWELRSLASRLGSALGRFVSPVATEMEAKAVQALAKEELAGILGVKLEPPLTDLTEVRARRNEAWEALRTAETSLALAQSKADGAARLLSALEGELGPLSVRVVNGETPFCPICNVAVDKVLAEGCGISVLPCDLTSLRAEYDRKRQDCAETNSSLEQLRRDIARHRAEVATAKQKLEPLDKALRALESAQTDRSRRVRAAERVVDEAERFAEAVAARERALKDIKTAEADLVKLKAELDAHRSRAGDVISQVSTRFEDVLRHLVPGDVTGTAKLDGNGLHLRVAMGDEGRTSAAIESLKIVAFDLAVLVRTIEGETSLPAFFIHDSPREADLGRSIYNQLFEYAVGLEKVGEGPSFQYIVTTTTAPPEVYSKEPWVRLELHGTPADRRLLKLNL